MLRQIITALKQSFTLQFPAEMLGKTVEIIAFELKDSGMETITEADKAARLKRIQNITKKSLVDLSKFNFNRDEANDYDA